MYNGEGIVSSVNDIREIGYPQASIKINSKSTKDLTVRPQTIKILEENICEKLFDIDLGNIFLNMTKLQTKIYRWDDTILKIFYTAKESEK